MKLLYNKSSITVQLLIALMFIILNSCSNDNELDIQQNFPFELQVMPVPKELIKGQTVEIRFTIISTGNFKNTTYKLRYFQFDGEGSLQYYDNSPYQPNDLYELPTKEFRLYYTSTSSVSQAFDVWISDNFGNEKQVSFQFNSRDKE